MGFVLDGIVAAVSSLSARSLGGAGEAGTKELSKLHKAGVRVALCTEDPTISQQSDDALGVEYTCAERLLGFTLADMAEIAQSSCDLSSFSDLHRYRDDAKGSGRNVSEASHAGQDDITSAGVG